MVEPTYPGVRVPARLVGVIWVGTDHGREAKLVCVPLRDPAYGEVHDLGQLPEHRLQEITHFFDIYRDRDPGKDVYVDGSDGVAVAAQVLKPGPPLTAASPEPIEPACSSGGC